MRYDRQYSAQNNPSSKATHADPKLALLLIFTPYARTLSVASLHQSNAKIVAFQKSAHDLSPFVLRSHAQQIVWPPSFPTDTRVLAAMLLCWQRAPQPKPVEAMTQHVATCRSAHNNNKNDTLDTLQLLLGDTNASETRKALNPLYFSFSFALHFLDLPPSLLDGPRCQKG